MRVTSNKAVRTFFRIRFYLVGTVLLSYILYDWFNLHNFLLVLILTAAAMSVLGFILARLHQKRRIAEAEQSET